MGVTTSASSKLKVKCPSMKLLWWDMERVNGTNKISFAGDMMRI